MADTIEIDDPTDRGPAVTEDYLNDGVYASYDGGSIALDLRGQDDTTRIVIDDDTWKALKRFAARVGW